MGNKGSVEYVTGENLILKLSDQYDQGHETDHKLIRVLFESYDFDHKGYLDRDSSLTYIKALLRALGFEASMREAIVEKDDFIFEDYYVLFIQNMFTQMDENRDGVIQFDEFLRPRFEDVREMVDLVTKTTTKDYKKFKRRIDRKKSKKSKEIKKSTVKGNKENHQSKKTVDNSKVKAGGYTQDTGHNQRSNYVKPKKISQISKTENKSVPKKKVNNNEKLDKKSRNISGTPRETIQEKTKKTPKIQRQFTPLAYEVDVSSDNIISATQSSDSIGGYKNIDTSKSDQEIQYQVLSYQIDEDFNYMGYSIDDDPSLSYTPNYNINGNYSPANKNLTSSSVDISSSSDNVNYEQFLHQAKDDLVDPIILEILKEFGKKNFILDLLNENTSLNLYKLFSIAKTVTEKTVKSSKTFYKRLNSELKVEKDKKNSFFTAWDHIYFNSLSLIERSEIAYNFEETSQKIAENIILENSLPNFMKSIKPINTGGIAGGEKYISNGILFKFAQDASLSHGSWLYGGSKRNDEIAGKALSSEIKALKALYSFLENHPGTDSIRYPLMNKISFCGLTICASTLLPISNSSLCYGSSDAGKSYGEPPEELEKCIGLMGSYFHFISHPVIDSKKDLHDMVLAADVEVHYVDGNYYFLDFGRFLPTNSSSAPLVNFFREEFIVNKEKMKQLQLSCDAFLGFGCTDRDFYNNKSLAVIQRFHNYIDREFWDGINRGDIILREDNVKEVLHSEGINLRYLGILRNTALRLFSEEKNSLYLKISFYLLQEMILRSVKSITNRRLNDINSNTILSSDAKMKQFIFDFYEGLNKESSFWEEVALKREILYKFGGNALLPSEIKETINLIYILEYNSPSIEFYYAHLNQMSLEKNPLTLYWNYRDQIDAKFSMELNEILDQHYTDLYEFEFETFKERIPSYSHFIINGNSILNTTLLFYTKSIFNYVYLEKNIENMYEYIKNEQTDLLNILLKYHPDFLQQNQILINALNYGASAESIKTLINFKAKINEVDDEDKSCIHHALILAIEQPLIYTPIIKTLLEKNAKVNFRYNFYDSKTRKTTSETVFHLVVLIDCVTVWDIFLKHYRAVIVAILDELREFAWSQNKINSHIYLGKITKVKTKMKTDTDLNACINGNLGDLQYLSDNWNPENSDKRIYLACENGHLDIVHYLFDKEGHDVGKLFGGNTLLHISSANGHLDVVKYLLSKGENIDSQTSNGNTPIFSACLEGHIDVVKFLLSENADDTIQTIQMSTPLWAACQGNHLDIVSFLIEEGNVDVNFADESGETVLWRVCLNGYLEIAEYLIEHGADIEKYNFNGETPLYVASQNGHLNIIKFLISSGSSVELPKNTGTTPLHIACQSGHLPVVEYLIAQGANLDGENNDGCDALWFASFGNQVKLMKYLISQGLKLDAQDDYGETALFIACENGNLEAVEYLISKRADIELAQNSGISPVFIASEKGHLEIVKSLKTFGADIDQISKTGASPLFAASEKGHLDIVLYLLKNSAEINRQRVDNGSTPLWMASYEGHFDIARCLVEHQANINLQDSRGYSPFVISCYQGNLKIAKYLLEQGADINITDNNGYTAVMLTSFNNDLETLKFLCENNASIDHVASDGHTALTVAKLQKHDNVIMYLESL